MPDIAEFTSVSFARNGQEILSNLNWSLRSTDRWVVVGPNGAGKTTVLSMLAALTYPSSGSLEILGEKVGRTNLLDLRTRIGFASTDMTKRIPRDENVLDTVLTARPRRHWSLARKIRGD